MWRCKIRQIDWYSESLFFILLHLVNLDIRKIKYYIRFKIITNFKMPCRISLLTDFCILLMVSVIVLTTGYFLTI